MQKIFHKIKYNKILSRTLAILPIFILSMTTVVFAQGIVICGAGSDVANACKITDLFRQSSQLAGFVLKVIFPAVFFFGLFMVAWPLINQFNDPSGNALATVKKRAKMLATGTIFVVGAFLIIKAILAALGYTGTDTIVQPVNTLGFLDIFVTQVHAQNFLPNPLSDVSVQKVTLGVANVFAYIIIVGSILGVIRGVMLLLLTQENPANLEKGKNWIIRSLAAAAIILGAQLIYSLISGTVSSVFG